MSAPETTPDQRLRDLEATAYRTGQTLADHGEQLAAIREQQTTAFSNIDSLADTIGAPGERTIAQRLDTIETDISEIKTDMADLKVGMDEILAILRKQ